MNTATLDRPTEPARATAGVETMRAMVQSEYGSAEVLVLRNIDKPKIGDHDVLVQVRAAGVNPGDWVNVELVR